MPARDSSTRSYQRSWRSLREPLERNIWPRIPPGELGRALTRAEEDQILGYGPEGC